ncbi:hypothetical protein ACLKA6_018328 [Drosophila palustris]
MRFCFDRLCFATKRPANNPQSTNEPCSSNISSNSNNSTTATTATTNAPTASTSAPQSPHVTVYAEYQKLQPAIIRRDDTEAKPPDIIQTESEREPTETKRESESESEQKQQQQQEEETKEHPQPQSRSHFHFHCQPLPLAVLRRLRRHSSAEDRQRTYSNSNSKLNTYTNLRKAISMQQEPNANYQFQPDLGLVNIVNNNNNHNFGQYNNSNGNNNNNNNNGGFVTLPAANSIGLLGLEHTSAGLRLIPAQAPPCHSDVLTHTLIYGTPPSGTPQQLHTDPRSLLHQQELQLQQRYQQLQQLQAQTQGVYTASGSPVPVLYQPAQLSQPVAIPGACHSPTTQQQFLLPPQHQQQQQPPNSLALSQQMQGLRISSCSGQPGGNSATSSPVGMVDPTVMMSNNTYVAATQQEERFIQIIQAKELKIQEMQRALQFKDNEIAELRSHLDKFQSVFPFSRGSAAGSGSASTCTGNGGAGGPNSATGATRKSGQTFQRQRAQGISAEPQNESSVLLENVSFSKYEKDERSRELIKSAILDNDFMKNLDLAQIREIVDCMYPVKYPAKNLIIKEGDVGSIVYVMEGE